MLPPWRSLTFFSSLYHFDISILNWRLGSCCLNEPFVHFLFFSCVAGPNKDTWQDTLLCITVAIPHTCLALHENFLNQKQPLSLPCGPATKRFRVGRSGGHLALTFLLSKCGIATEMVDFSWPSSKSWISVPKVRRNNGSALPYLLLSKKCSSSLAKVF